MKSIFTKLLVILLLSCAQLSAISQTNHVVISQLFGSGGTTTTLPNYDFIELYNPTASLVNVNGWTVQFAFGTATTYTKIALSGGILPYGYYLIQLGRDNIATGTAMPAPDVIYNYNINTPDMKIGVVNNTASISGTNPSAACIDFVGTGAANGYEGSGTAAQGSYLVSLLRKTSATSTAASMSSTGAEFNKGNGWDTNNNAADLLLTTYVVARNSNISPLAVNLLTFNLTKSGQTNLLSWQVASAEEGARFEVEKSSDGVSFSRIGETNKNIATAYRFTDDNTTVSAYYRIRIIGKDGSSQYSPVVFAEGKGAASIKIYPTLATGWVMVQLPQNKGGEVMVYGMDGRLQQRVTAAANEAQIKLPVATLKPGTYVVQYLTAAGQKTVERFVKAG